MQNIIMVSANYIKAFFIEQNAGDFTVPSPSNSPLTTNVPSIGNIAAYIYIYIYIYKLRVFMYMYIYIYTRVCTFMRITYLSISAISLRMGAVIRESGRSRLFWHRASMCKPCLLTDCNTFSSVQALKL